MGYLEVAAANLKLEEENRQLRADAERYRYIRALPADEWDDLFTTLPRRSTPEQMDEHIDAHRL